MVIEQPLIKEIKNRNNIRYILTGRARRVNGHDTWIYMMHENLLNSKVVCSYWKKVGKSFHHSTRLVFKTVFRRYTKCIRRLKFPFRIDRKMRLSKFRGNWVPSY